MSREDTRGPNGEEPIHNWFELSYANYLVLPRSLLQSMPYEWQQRFTTALDELLTAYDYLNHDLEVEVKFKDPARGRYVLDPIPHYDRGRAYVEPKKSASE